MYVLVFILGIFMFSSAYENLAYQRPATQSTSHDPNVSGPLKAVDGKKSDLSYSGGQCSVSKSLQSSAWWWVNLNGVRSIKSIVIYYRTDNVKWDASNGYTNRFMGFYLYISNSTNRLDGHLCFHDTNYTRSTIPAIANISCPVHGQYVIYYNERPLKNDTRPNASTYAFVELCEVEVYGCSSPNRYGTDCSSICPKNCDGYCNIESGDCFQCKSGYKRPKCEDECTENFFGARCKEICGHCLNKEQCHHINGTCPNGCDKGFESQFCNKTCSDGYFGENCKSECNATCKGCNRTNGICENGCQPGWRGTYCHKECKVGRFGVDCGEVCGHCLNLDQCHHINGTCLNGCEKGYEGQYCNKTCQAGYFGEDCFHVCNITCIGCNRTNGLCDSGCHPGWEGEYCQKSCSYGHFGSNCMYKCNRTCKGCDKTSGVCGNGCFAGWKGLYCQEGKLFEEGYGNNKQYSISTSIKQIYKIRAEQTRTSETSEVGSAAMEE